MEKTQFIKTQVGGWEAILGQAHDLRKMPVKLPVSVLGFVAFPTKTKTDFQFNCCELTVVESWVFLIRDPS